MARNDTNEIQCWFLRHRLECFVCAIRDVTRLFCTRSAASRKRSSLNGTSNFKQSLFLSASGHTLAATEHCCSSPRLDGFI